MLPGEPLPSGACGSGQIVWERGADPEPSAESATLAQGRVQVAHEQPALDTGHQGAPCTPGFRSQSQAVFVLTHTHTHSHNHSHTHLPRSLTHTHAPTLHTLTVVSHTPSCPHTHIPHALSHPYTFSLTRTHTLTPTNTHTPPHTPSLTHTLTRVITGSKDRLNNPAGQSRTRQ